MPLVLNKKHSSWAIKLNKWNASRYILHAFLAWCLSNYSCLRILVFTPYLPLTFTSFSSYYCPLKYPIGHYIPWLFAAANHWCFSRYPRATRPSLYGIGFWPYFISKPYHFQRCIGNRTRTQLEHYGRSMVFVIRFAHGFLTPPHTFHFRVV